MRRPVSRPSHASADPAAERSASITYPPSAPRETTIPGSGGGTCPTGTDTPAIDPHDTIGRAVVAATPSSSHARSPAPATTGVPAGTPSEDAIVGRMLPMMVVGPTTSGRSSAPSRPAPSRASRPVRDATDVSVTPRPVSRNATRSLGPMIQRCPPLNRSGSCRRIHATFAATVPASGTTPVSTWKSGPSPAAISPALRSADAIARPTGSPAVVTGTNVSRWLENPTASTCARSSSGSCAHASSVDDHHVSGSCSTQPGRGCSTSTAARPTAIGPSSDHSAAFVALVPRSIVRIRITLTSLRRQGSS